MSAICDKTARAADLSVEVCKIYENSAKFQKKLKKSVRKIEVNLHVNDKKIWRENKNSKFQLTVATKLTAAPAAAFTASLS